MFAAAVQGVFGVGNDLRIEIASLRDELLVDGAQKWLHRFRDFFPGTRRVGIRGRADISPFGFNSQHHQKVTFATRLSQTSYAAHEKTAKKFRG
jgi:hypothetical protein